MNWTCLVGDLVKRAHIHLVNRESELLLLAFAQIVSVDLVTQAACCSFHENNHFVLAQTPFKGIRDLKNVDFSCS